MFEKNYQTGMHAIFNDCAYSVRNDLFAVYRAAEGDAVLIGTYAR